MKKYLLLTMVGVCAYIAGWTQFSISGKVTDAETSEPIYGASIYIADLKTGASTDTNGRFVIRNVPQGRFLGEIRMIGYATQAVMLDALEEGKIYDSIFNWVRLVKTPTEHQPVLIFGISGATERFRDPVPTTMQSRDHMLQHSSTNAVNALAELPGISSVNTGNAISKPIIRGLGYNRVVVLRNGMRQEGQQWGDEHGVEIDEFEIDHVEIIKGPGSIIYGSDAMGGVINFLTPRPLEAGKISGELVSAFQSNGMLFGNSLMNAGNVNGVSWQIRGSQKMSGNYQTPADGFVANSGFKEMNASGFIGLNRGWGVSQLFFSTFNQTVGLPEGERDSLGQFLLPVALGDSVAMMSFTDDQLRNYSRYIEIPRQEIHHHRIGLTTNLFFGHSQFRIDFSFQQNNRNEFANALDANEIEIGMQLNTFNVNAIYYSRKKQNSRLTTGINLQHQQNNNTGSEAIIPEYTSDDAGIFAHYTFFHEAWLFSAGARGDIRLLDAHGLILDTTIKFGVLNKSFLSVSAIAGISYQPATPTVFRLNISRGFRSPNISELSSNGRHEGTFRYERGNSSLKPETSLQVDLGMSYTSDHFNLELSAFGNGIQHYTYLTKVNSVFGGDSIADPSDPAPVYTFVQGRATLYGGEIYTDLHPHPLDWLHFENSFSMVMAELADQPDSTRYLPFIPPMKYQAEINARTEKKIGPFEHAYAGVAFAVYFAQDRFYSAYGTETSTPAYTLLEAGFGTDVVNRKGITLARIFFSANNLLNTVYQSHLSRLKYAPENPLNGKRGIYAPGRNFSIRVVIPFTFRRN